MILQDWDSTQPGQDGGQVSFFFCPLDEVFTMIAKYKDEVFTKYKTLFQISADGCACEKVLAKQWNLTQLSPRDQNRSWIWKSLTNISRHVLETTSVPSLTLQSKITLHVLHLFRFPASLASKSKWVCEPGKWVGDSPIPLHNGELGKSGLYNMHCGQKGCNAGWREHWILNHDPAIMKRYKSQKEDK